MAIGKKMLFGALLAACACSVYGTTNIVHDAARDLVLNTASKAVYTNFYGGVWSFMRSTSYTGERTLMPSVRYYEGPGTDGSGTNYFGADLKIQWERGPAKNDGVGYNLPVIAVNPSPWADTNAYLRGGSFPAIPAKSILAMRVPCCALRCRATACTLSQPRRGTVISATRRWRCSSTAQ